MSAELPRGWTTVALCGLVVPRAERVKPENFRGARYVGLEHVEPHTNRLIATVPAEAMTSSAARFYTGDVLYGRLRPYLNKVLLARMDGLASAEFIVLPQVDAVDARFLLWRFSSSDFVEFACSQYEGDRPRVNFGKLGKFSIHLPPRAEQTRIVDKLEELLSDLDAGVAELKAAQRKLAQYRQSLLKAAAEGALTAQWRAQNPPNETGAQLLDRILKERRARWEAKQLAKFKEQGKAAPKGWQEKYPEPINPDTTDLPELPKGWAWATISQLSVEQKYGSSAKTGEHSDGVPVLRMGNIQDGLLDLRELKYLPTQHNEFPELLLADGDLLFNRTNSPELVGKCAVYRSQLSPCSYASYLISVRFVSLFLPELAAAYINSAFGRRWIKSVAAQQVGQANVNGTKLAALSIPLPPAEEQQEIARMLSHQVELCDAQAASIEISLRECTAQHKNILKAAFSGQLVPHHPNDEPASVLLDRIRAERAAQSSPAKRARRRVSETT